MEYSAAFATNRPGRATAVPALVFDARHACALLAADPERGLRYAVRGLDESSPALEDPAWRELLELLARNPFVAALRARAHGYPGDPPVTEAALAGLIDAAGSAAPRDWLLQHATICRALRSRTVRLAEAIDAAVREEPGAVIVGIAAGYAPELRFSMALRAAPARVTLVEPDARSRAVAARLCESPSVGIRRATVADLIGGSVRIRDAALIVVPTLAESLPLDTLLDLLAALAVWLRPGGTLVLPFFTSLPDAGFLRWVGDWRPNQLAAAELRRRAADAADLTARIEYDGVPGLAYLRIERDIDSG